MLLTVDIGTSRFKSALWDYELNRLAFAAVPLSISGDARCEADCAQWLKAFEDCLCKLGPAEVEAVIISGNGPTLVPVLGEPVWDNFFAAAKPARLWLDRAGSEGSLKRQEKVSSLMGGFVDAGFFLPKILGIKDEENGLYRRVKYFLGCPEYLAYALTGEARTTFPSDGFDRWFWNDSVLEKLELDAAKFPPFIRPGGQYGNVAPSVAARFGFANNVPVIAGGPDFFAAILGSAAVKPGQACDRTGSSEGINLCTQNRVNDERLMSYGHPVRPYWNLSGVINTTGKAVEWASGLLGLSGVGDFFTLAENAAPGSGGVFLPYLAGERSPVWDPSARGLWRGISLSAGRREFAASVLEGICFAVRDVLAVMEEAADEPNARMSELRVTGGLAGVGMLNQLKADITGKVIHEPVQKEAELLGLAITGGCFLGKFASVNEAARAVRIEKSYEPDTGKAAVYDNLFSEYKKAKFTAVCSQAV